MSISIEMQGTERLVAKFDSYEVRLRMGLQTAMQKIVNKIVDYIKSSELSGQVLHRRTGTLSRSIKGIVTDDTDRVVGNVTSRDNGNAPVVYAAIHEYGGVIHHPAGKGTTYHKIDHNSQTVGGFITKKRALRLKNSIAIDHNHGAYDIHIPARPYFRPARDAQQAYIQQELKKCVVAENHK